MANLTNGSESWYDTVEQTSTTGKYTFNTEKKYVDKKLALRVNVPGINLDGSDNFYLNDGIYNYGWNVDSDGNVLISRSGTGSSTTGHIELYDSVNLAKLDGTFPTTTSNGITFTWNSDHTQCTLNGTNTTTTTSYSTFLNNSTNLGSFEAGKTYYFEVSRTTTNVYLGYYMYIDSVRGSLVGVGSSRWVTFPENATGIMLIAIASAGSTCTNAKLNVRVIGQNDLSKHNLISSQISSINNDTFFIEDGQFRMGGNPTLCGSDVSSMSTFRRGIAEKDSMVGVCGAASLLGSATAADILTGKTALTSSGLITGTMGFSAAKTGSKSLTSDTNGNWTVTHNLGVVPDLFFIYRSNGNVEQTYSILWAMRFPNIAYRGSTYVNYYGYHSNSSTTTVSCGNTTTRPITAVTSTTATISYMSSTSYYWRAGTYNWIAVKF